MMSEPPDKNTCENSGGVAFEAAPKGNDKENSGNKPGKIKWIVAIAVFCLVMLYVYPSASGCEPAKMLVILGVQAVPVAAIIALPLFSRRTWFWLGLYFFIALAAYIYYVHIIKIRPFPEAGDISLSGCYVAEVYYIEGNIRWGDSILLNRIYRDPAFIKVFDAKTKKCLHTSDFHNLEDLCPVFNFKDELSYGASYIIDTRCEKKFSRPVEHASQNSMHEIVLYLMRVSTK